MDGIGFDPLGWAAEGLIVGGAAVLTGAYTAITGAYSNLQDLFDAGPGAAPPMDPIGASQPPSAGEPAGFAPSPGYGGNQTAGPRPPTLAEVIAQAAVEETNTGISSPLGPSDPNFQYQPVPPAPESNDPQAPIKPGFVDTPQPITDQSLGQMVIGKYKGLHYNPNGWYNSWPTFRGQKGTTSNTPWDGGTAYAVPVMTEEGLRWQAVWKVTLGGRVVSTSTWDAGTQVPRGGEFDYMFDLGYDVASMLWNGDGVSWQTFSPGEVAVPPQPAPLLQQIGELGGNGPGPLVNPGDPSATDWDSLPDPSVDTDFGDGQNGPRPLPLVGPPTPQPVMPVAPVPLPVNNPQEVPVIGTDGLPVKVAELVDQTAVNTHLIGDLAVNTGQIRPELAAVAKEVGRIEQKTAALAKNVGQPGGIGDLSDLLQLLLTLLGFFESPISGTNYQLQGVCEDVNDGEDQPIADFPVPEAYNFDAIVQRLDVMQDLFQQHLAYRTPICRGQRRQGDIRTIHFISDEVSAGGKRRLDKRLRYRSQSGTDLGGLIDHWSGFTWQAGPVIVEHIDGPWGSVQVWASSIDEGKRVIRHAAGEAGIDPDQVGRWTVSGSTNSRYGLPGTMRVNNKGGYWWITARDGPSERPTVGKS